MSVLLPADSAAEIVGLLQAEADLSRFWVRADGETLTADELVRDAAAQSTAKGDLVVRFAGEGAPEPLGVGADSLVSYTVPRSWELVLFDPLATSTNLRAAMRAVDRALRGVRLTDAAGRLEPVGGWERVAVPEADTGEGWLRVFEDNYDDIGEAVEVPAGAGAASGWPFWGTAVS